MKPIITTLILTELAFAALLVTFVFGHSDSPGLARAWGELRRNPSPEAEANYKTEKSRTERLTLGLTIGAGLLLAANSYVLFKVIRKVSAGDTKPKPI